jgi:hypothetical protein
MRLDRVLASLTVIGILACGGGGASVDPAWAAYREAALRILDDYDRAMNDVAIIDSALVDFNGGQGKITTDTAVSQLDQVVIPKLAKVAESAGQLQTPNHPDLTAAHAPLITGLRGKVEGWKGMTEAYKRRDESSFNTALGKLSASDALIKKYRADFQRWSEEGRVFGVGASSAAAAAPAASAQPAVGGVPGMAPSSGVGAVGAPPSGVGAVGAPPSGVGAPQK